MVSAEVGRRGTEPYWRGVRRRFGVALLVGAVLLVLAAWFFSDDLNCEADAGESNYGEAEWSWFPVGTTCRWTEEVNGFDRFEEPGWAPTVVLAGMFLTGLGLALASPRQRSDDT